MRIIDALKPWMVRFDRMALQQRAGLVAATAAVLYFVLSLALVGQNQARGNAHRQRIEAQKTELEAVRKDIRELSAALEHDPNAQQQAQLDGMRRVIVEADARLVQFDGAQTRGAGAVLRELLGATPGLELVSLKTLPVIPEFQSKAAPANPAKPAPGAKDAAPGPEMAPQPPRSIYRHGIEISIKGNYLALLPYLEKLQQYPGHLYWTEVSLDVRGYPAAVLTMKVYTLSGQTTLRLG